MTPLKMAKHNKESARFRFVASSRIEMFKTLALAAGFVAFFIPAEYAIGSLIRDCWNLAAAIIGAIAIILHLVKSRITLRWVLLTLSIASYYLFSSLIMHSDFNLVSAVFLAIKTCGFVTLLEYGFTHYPKRCLNAFIIGGVFMCSWHYLTFLQYRDYGNGMNVRLDALYGARRGKYFFLLTHDNGSVFYFLPVLSAIWFRALHVTKNFRLPLIASVLTLYMYWSLWSVTAMLTTTFFVAASVYAWKSDCAWLRSAMTYKRALALGVLFCCVVIVFYSSPFMGAISAYLKKADDLGRGRIWELAMPYISQSPIFGVGYEYDAATVLKLRTNHCHNIILQLIYTGGLATCILFVCGLNAYDLPKQNRDSQPLTKGQLILCAAIIAFFAAATFDFDLHTSPQFLVFVLCRYSKEFSMPDLDCQSRSGIESKINIGGNS